MKKIILILIVFLPALVFGHGKKNGAIRAGFSEIGITPDKPIIMSGYGGRDNPYESVHDSIYAQAMYLAQGDEEVLVITSDLIGHSHVQVEGLKKMIEKEAGIAGEKIFITAAHNHGGPVNATYAPLDKLPQDVKDYVELLYNKLLQISLEAKENLQPVKIGFDRGECKMNINRRAVFSEGEIWLGRDADKACDHDLDIIKFTDPDGKLKAVHMNYPCHGTCTGQENFEISGDWPGISAQMMKDKLGDDVTIMVTAGASGDVAPIYGPHKYFREVNAVAFGIADVALELVDKCITTELSELKSATISKTYPGKKDWESSFPQESIPGKDIKINYSAFRMGNIVMAGISGELFTEIGMNVKMRTTTSTTILTHCNGASGYIVTDASYVEGGYEPMVTNLMPGHEADYENTLVELIKSLE